MTGPLMLWRRLDQPGHEAARLIFRDPYWNLAGTAVFVHDQEPCRLDYMVVCDVGWRTLCGKIEGWVGDEDVDIEVSVDSHRRWRLRGVERPEVEGCVDLDLAFSPSTNLLPIRRFHLSPGEEAAVRAAWLTFPKFTLEPLDQLYRRVDASAYHYESAGGEFATELKVNEAGFIISYPNLWQAEAST